MDYGIRTSVQRSVDSKQTKGYFQDSESELKSLQFAIPYSRLKIIFKLAANVAQKSPNCCRCRWFHSFCQSKLQIERVLK